MPRGPVDMQHSLGKYWFRTYCFLWAAATLFHQASLWRLARNPVLVLLTVVAAIVLVSKKRLGFLLLLALMQLVEVFVHAPYYSNHWLLTTAVNGTLLLSTLVSAITLRTLRPTREQVFSSFVPAARGLILGMYFWAVFHKLNSGFFTPHTSCATELLTGFGPLVPDAVRNNTVVQYASIFATLFVETLIPVLLFRRKTRHLGAFVGAGFHFVIGFNFYEAYYNFSAALLGIFWLFLEPSFVDKGASELDLKLEKLKEHFFWPFFVFGVRVAFVFILVWLGTWGNNSDKYQPLMVSIWVIYGLTYLAFVGTRLKDRGFGTEAKEPSYRGFMPPARILLVSPILFFANGFGPYLGAKTEQSLAMFSNLVTEAGESNHFIITKPFYLFGYQDKVIRIVETDDPFLEALRKDNRGMLWFEFRDHLSRNPDASVRYEVDGKSVTIERAGDHEEFRKKTPLLARKYLFFRHPDLGSPPRCQH